MTAKPQRRNIGDLLEIMAALRTPGSGCPWDLEQDFESIAPYTIEEAYEVADAIERKDMADLKDELGDLLLQVVYHAQMASEAGLFDFGDVVEAVSDKMVRRHPHVFGDLKIADAQELDGLWERKKAEERAANGGEKSHSATLSDVPVGLPALTRASKIQKRAARVGFDWPDVMPVFDKVREELAELKALAVEDAKSKELRARIAEEFGDFLFASLSLARHLSLDPESTLRAATSKFMRRFERVGAIAAENGHELPELDADQLDVFWEQVKAEERKGDSSPA